MRNLILRFARPFRGREWLPAALWAAAILAVSSIPSSMLGAGFFPGCDKVAHLIEYSVLGSLLRFWVAGVAARRPGSGGAVRPATLIVAALVFAALDEVHQRFIPGRTMDFWDFSADACGIVLGFLISGRVLRNYLFERDA